MIAFVSGEVVGRREDYVVIQTGGGVGYHLAVSAETLANVPPIGQSVSLHCHLLARDDSIALYGFAREEERDLFLMLLGVQGVGPKVALALLSGGPPRELASALASGDVARLQAVPGIGKRTAERILVELREKVIELGGVEQNYNGPATMRLKVALTKELGGGIMVWELLHDASGDDALLKVIWEAAQ